jgi:uncharacterized protein YjbI with pentapeptide repeats
VEIRAQAAVIVDCLSGFRGVLVMALALIHPRHVRGGRVIAISLLSSLVVSPGWGSAQPTAHGPLTRADVVARLSRATEAQPLSLAGEDLTGSDLTGLDLSHVNFSSARLQRAHLSHAKMFAVNLDHAAAQGADFTSAILDVTTMQGADFSHAILRSASLYAAILIGADFTDADLSGARIIATATGAKFVRANLSHADIGADPRNQPMGVMRTDFTNADLSGADLTGANLRKARLVRANLTGAIVTDADVSLADLTDAQLHQLHGRKMLRGLDRAFGVSDAHFDKDSGQQ